MRKPELDWLRTTHTPGVHAGACTIEDAQLIGPGVNDVEGAVSRRGDPSRRTWPPRVVRVVRQPVTGEGVCSKSEGDGAQVLAQDVTLYRFPRLYGHEFTVDEGHRLWTSTPASP